ALAGEQEPRRVKPLREREEPAARDRLRPPLHAFAPVEELADRRMRLQLLEQVVDGELRVAVVETDDHADREQVVAHRVDERAAELPVARAGSEWPAHRVDDPAEWLRDAPDLLDAELPGLGVLPTEAEVLDRRAGQVPLRALREHGHARDEVRARLEV